MNIKILDSWLREYLKTKATVKEIGEYLSLTSVSVERIEKYGDKDWTYDIEVTTNRPDLMSVVGIAREAAAVLPQFGIKATFHSPSSERSESRSTNSSRQVPIQSGQARTRNNTYQDQFITFKNNPKLVNRLLGVIMEVNLHESPQVIKDRLESSDIRSLNNVIDVTNYVMREMGHPTHVFDYDRLTTKTLEIREARKGEKVTTLDNKEYKLNEEDIVGDDGLGHIIDLLGVMGTANSVVTDNTKRILFFIDNVEPTHIRHTSMSTGIRTEAAVLNEKGIDPELSYQALLRGIELYKELANAKQLSEIIDMYPNVPPEKTVTITQAKINQIIGVEIPVKKSREILESLGFDIAQKNDTLKVTIPSWRKNDVDIPEDIVEEVARIYGYHILPSKLPPIQSVEYYHEGKNEFYWEERVKEAFKYWGFTEVYTYSLVSEDLLEGPPQEALKLKNPLTDDMVYMRKTLVPSLLKAVQENPSHEEIKIFELSNIYHKKSGDLPDEVLSLAGVIKKENVSFYEVKGIIETLFHDIGIKIVIFKDTKQGGEGADVYLSGHSRPDRESSLKKDKTLDSRFHGNDKEVYIGTIEILDSNLINFELNFEEILKQVSMSKIYTPPSKFPPIIEDIRIQVDPHISYEKIAKLISSQNPLVVKVELLDIYEDKKTFRIFYQSNEKNLTNEDVTPIRGKITIALQRDLKAKIA